MPRCAFVENFAKVCPRQATAGYCAKHRRVFKGFDSPATRERLAEARRLLEALSNGR